MSPCVDRDSRYYSEPRPRCDAEWPDRVCWRDGTHADVIRRFYLDGRAHEVVAGVELVPGDGDDDARAVARRILDRMESHQRTQFYAPRGCPCAS